jgi:hypothetical protein
MRESLGLSKQRTFFGWHGRCYLSASREFPFHAKEGDLDLVTTEGNTAVVAHAETH